MQRAHPKYRIGRICHGACVIYYGTGLEGLLRMGAGRDGAAQAGHPALRSRVICPRGPLRPWLCLPRSIL